MGVRDHLDRVAAWFGFGVDEDDYYEDEDERRSSPYGKDRSSPDRGGSDDEPGPAVRRLGRTERSSAFGTSLGDLFGSEASRGAAHRHSGQNPHPHPSPLLGHAP